MEAVVTEQTSSSEKLPLRCFDLAKPGFAGSEREYSASLQTIMNDPASSDPPKPPNTFQTALKNMAPPRIRPNEVAL
jgi:hypothetical protein